MGALQQTEMPHFALQKIMFLDWHRSDSVGICSHLLVPLVIKVYKALRKVLTERRYNRKDYSIRWRLWIPQKKVSKINVSCLQNTLGQNWGGACVGIFNVLTKLQRTWYSFIHALIHPPVKIRIKPKAAWRHQFYCIWWDGLNPTPDILGCHDWRSHSVKLEEQLRSFICEEREHCINLHPHIMWSAVQATNQISLLNHKKQLPVN